MGALVAGEGDVCGVLVGLEGDSELSGGSFGGRQ